MTTRQTMTVAVIRGPGVSVHCGPADRLADIVAVSPVTVAVVADPVSVIIHDGRGRTRHGRWTDNGRTRTT